MRRSPSRRRSAIGWLDCWELSAGAKDVDLAHAWINACLDSAVGKVLTEKQQLRQHHQCRREQDRRHDLRRPACPGSRRPRTSRSASPSGTRSRRPDLSPSDRQIAGREHLLRPIPLRRRELLMPLATVSPKLTSARRRV